MKIILLLILVFLIFIGVVSAQSITVNAPQSAEVNDIFTVEITVNVNGMLGVYFDLTYDNTVLEGLTIEEGNLMKQCTQRVHGSPPSIDNSLGKIHFDDTCLGSTITGSGTVAVIKLKAISPKTSDIVLQTVYMSNSTGDPITNININNRRVMVESKSKGYKNNAIVLTNISNTSTENKENKTINQTLNKTLNSTKDAVLLSLPKASKEQDEEVSPQVNNASPKIQESEHPNIYTNQWLWFIPLILIFIAVMLIKKFKN